MTRIVTTLSTLDLDAIEDHLLRLNQEDRYLRFFTFLSDEAIRGYVRRVLNLTEGRGFGIFDGDRLVAFAHVSRIEEVGIRVTAELGISVNEDFRGQGLSTLLMDRGILYCRNNRINTLFMSCLRENRAMQHVARKAGLATYTNADEAFAELQLTELPKPSDFWREAGYEHISLFDKIYRRQRQWLDTMLSLGDPRGTS